VAIWPYLLFALAAGAMLPIQFGINAQLASWVGGSLRAALVSFVVGTAALLLAAPATAVTLLRVVGILLLAGGVVLVRQS
jgi:bacterial/archaeal transporter family-2 protein